MKKWEDKHRLTIYNGMLKNAESTIKRTPSITQSQTQAINRVETVSPRSVESLSLSSPTNTAIYRLLKEQNLQQYARVSILYRNL